MLNRIYIIVGLLVIAMLAGAFIAPHLIRWGDYRTRMEELASSVLGARVAIRGDIEFSFLPQPRLRFDNVLVGKAEEPVATADSIEAEFALIDFLRDNYTMKRLVLRQPVIEFTIDENGFFDSGVMLAGRNGGLGQAIIDDATIRLIDRRVGETYIVDQVSGELRLSSLAGPLSFQGRGQYRSENFSLRVNASAADAEGRSRVSLFLQPQTQAYSFSADGVMTPGVAPKFDGDIVYRQRRMMDDPPGAIYGDLVFESKLRASLDRIVLSSYAVQPDENRAGMRLTGSASIQLGKNRRFDAVLSGGVFSWLPRGTREETGRQPYAVMRLLAELPVPVMPPLPGRIGVDLADMELRGFSLRNVHIDATTDGKSWQIEQFMANLPGETIVQINGQLTRESERPAFRGQALIVSERLDGLSQLWRKPDADDPLFNVSGRISGRVMLAGEALGLVNGVLTLDGVQHGLEVRAGYGAEQRLDVVAHFDTLGPRGSRMVAALLPNIITEPAFGISFPEGSFSVTAKAATVLDLDGIGLVGEGQWIDGVMTVSRLAAEQWGGVGFDGQVVIGGVPAAPRVSGDGHISIAAGAVPALDVLYDLARVPKVWQDFFARSAPANLVVTVSDPLEGGQVVTLDGQFGAGELNLRAELAGGLGEWRSGVRLAGAVEGEDIAGLTQQIGLGDMPFFGGDGSMLVSFALDGSAEQGFNGRARASLGDEGIGFAGFIGFNEAGEVNGDGVLEINLDNAGILIGSIGAPSLVLPAIDGTGKLHFEGGRLAQLTDLAAKSGTTGFGGTFSFSHIGTNPVLTGELIAESISLEGLAAILFGPAALVSGGGLWPEGPVMAGEASRVMRGSVSVRTDAITANSVMFAGKTGFEINWDEMRLRLARGEASIGGGRLGLDITVCCAGQIAEKTISGRVTLESVPVEALGVSELGALLSASIDGGLRFEGTGASLAEALAMTAGEGNITLADLVINKLSPQVYATIAGLGDMLDMEADALSTIMGLALGQGPFVAERATGAFTLAGGVMRLANFMVDGEGASIAGGVNLTLETLGLSGSFIMMPRDFTDTNGLVNADTARVVMQLGGTLLLPQVTLNLDEIIAAIQVRANEMEVERLEILHQQDIERQRAAAAERNRLIEGQRQRAAEAEARRAEEAAEARRLQEQQLFLP